MCEGPFYMVYGRWGCTIAYNCRLLCALDMNVVEDNLRVNGSEVFLDCGMCGVLWVCVYV